MHCAYNNKVLTLTVVTAGGYYTLSHLVQTLYMLGVRLPADRLLEWSKSLTVKVCWSGTNMLLNQVHTRESFFFVSCKNTCTQNERS